MRSPLDMVSHAFAAVEDRLDRAKLAYQWRFDRFTELSVLAYPGFGTRDRLRLTGRVLDDEAADREVAERSRLANALRTLRAIESDDIPNALVRLRGANREVEVRTDRDGYWRCELETDGVKVPDDRWVEVEVEVLEPKRTDRRPVTATARVMVPAEDAEFGVISDLDDTVVKTGATDTLRFVRTVLLNSPGGRVPFPGVAGLYRALQLGPDDRGVNPIVYVSSSPTNLYSHFAGFLEARGVPAGPILLKDFGFDDDKLLKKGHEGYKLGRIEAIVETYPDLTWVVIGDSGQKDPEVFREAVRRWPDRIRAVVIRDVTDPPRDDEVDRIAGEIEDAGVPSVVAATTRGAARRLRELELISEKGLEETEEAADEEETERGGRR